MVTVLVTMATPISSHVKNKNSIHRSGQIVARTKTCTVPPCVYTGPAELDEYLNG